MTEAHFRQSGNHFMASMSGHADYRKDGRDEVCAAVSTLAQTLLQAVIDAQARGLLINITMSRKNGDVSVDLLTGEEGKPAMMEAFLTVARGFEMLSAKYPQNVSTGRNFQDDPLQ